MSDTVEQIPATNESALVDQLREAVDRQRVAIRNLGRAVVDRLVSDEQFAILAVKEAVQILPCALTRRLERFARGDHWAGLCAMVAADRRLVQLLSKSRVFREAAISDVVIAQRMAECSSARTAANEAGKRFRLSKRGAHVIVWCASCPERQRHGRAGDVP